MATAVGTYLREKRIAGGIGLRRLAQWVGISASYVCRVEQGHEKIPQAEITQKWCSLIAADFFRTMILGRRVHPKILDYLRDTPDAQGVILMCMARRVNPDWWTGILKQLGGKPWTEAAQ